MNASAAVAVVLDVSSEAEGGPIRLVIVAAGAQSRRLVRLFTLDAGFHTALATSANDVRAQAAVIDVTLIDLAGLGRAEATVAELVQAAPSVPVVALTPALDDARLPFAATDVERLICVVDDTNPDEILAVVRAAARSPRRTAIEPQLTARQRDVLVLVGAGLSNKQIARRLGISESTVKAHLTKAYRALAVTSRTGAADWSRGLATSRV